MKYITTSSKEDLKWSRIYCPNDNTIEDVIKSMNDLEYIGPFHKEEHTNAGCPEIKNDTNLFIMKNQYNVTEIWQIGSKASDIQGSIIPHTYCIRCIGTMFEDTNQLDKLDLTHEDLINIECALNWTPESLSDDLRLFSSEQLSEYIERGYNLIKTYNHVYPNCIYSKKDNLAVMAYLTNIQ